MRVLFFVTLVALGLSSTLGEPLDAADSAKTSDNQSPVGHALTPEGAKANSTLGEKDKMGVIKETGSKVGSITTDPVTSGSSDLMGGGSTKVDTSSSTTGPTSGKTTTTAPKATQKPVDSSNSTAQKNTTKKSAASSIQHSTLATTATVTIVTLATMLA